MFLSHLTPVVVILRDSENILIDPDSNQIHRIIINFYSVPVVLEATKASGVSMNICQYIKGHYDLTVISNLTIHLSLQSTSHKEYISHVQGFGEGWVWRSLRLSSEGHGKNVRL